MNDATNGSVQTGNPDGASAAAAANGSGGGAQIEWWSGLQDEGNRKTVEAKGWNGKGLDDVLTSYRELESRLGKALTLPGENATSEDWTAFYAKIGRPEKADGYSFKMPEGLPENFPYDGKSAEAFKNWAHEAGLTPKQAQAVHDHYVKSQASSLVAMQEANAKAVEAAHDALVKVWGDPSGESYKRNQELANRAIRNQGGKELTDELKALGALGPNGEVKSPRLALMLAKVGGELYAEDSLFGGAGAMKNPFKEGPDFNMQEQGRLVRNDPETAKVFMRQVGLDPKTFGLK